GIRDLIVTGVKTCALPISITPLMIDRTGIGSGARESLAVPTRIARAIINGVIARAVRLAQTASPTTSLVLLVAFNLVPLIGVLAWGWNVATLLVLYWVENGIVGILNVPKMLLAAAPETGTAGPRITPAGVAFTKGGQVVFFLMHYGIFWLVHGVFVWT